MRKFKGVKTGQIQYFRIFLATKNFCMKKREFRWFIGHEWGIRKVIFPPKESMV